MHGVEADSDGVTPDAIEAFITRWRGSGGAELSNTHSFLNELCDLLGVPRPDPYQEETALNDYVFERQVTRAHEDGTRSVRRIDLYKRGCFVLEAKQGSVGGGSKPADAAQANLFGPEAGKARAGTAKRGTDAWFTAMVRAKAQAERYAKDLPAQHGWPPFLITCDVGYCFEVYADFSGQGKSYDQFPDRRGFRILLDDLTRPEIRARLRAIWTDPHSLDPARETARVTKEIAARLARVARDLETRKSKDGRALHSPEQVALFLMRCLFTMFAEDVKLLPEGKFTELLGDLTSDARNAHVALEALWREMNEGAALSGWLRAPIRRFNGGLFKDASAPPLTAEMVSELHIAAKQDWRQVEPAIFGTLLEQALDKAERHRLGAHYTPRAYVDRLVTPTIMEPLREDWAAVKAKVEGLLREGKKPQALKALREFHAALCEVRVLDPACGTGNFLYVAMERMKRLEGEVVDAVVELGGRAQSEYRDHAIDPHQFLGIELNPRAAAIAELVLWIGYIQWQVRAGGVDFIYDPVLRDFHNIENRDAVLDRGEAVLRRDEDGKPVTRWDGETYKPHPVTGEKVPDEAARVEIWDYPEAKPARWPEAEFIIGNPPFIGGKDLRAELGDGYAEALWKAHPKMPKSADFVMYWWNYAADLTAKADKAKTATLRRFGFITTNSLRQTFNRRVVERALSGKPPLSLLYAIPDHPWMKSVDKAAVRIAMTVAGPGEELEGVLAEVVRESGLNSDAPEVELNVRRGVITPMIRIGAAVSSAKALRANEGICSPGVKLHGAGFIVKPEKAAALGLGKNPAAAEVIKPYRNGRDINQKPRGVMVIDLSGLSEAEAHARYPQVLQHVIDHVKPDRMQNRRSVYSQKWWLYGEPRRELRAALKGVKRSIVTTETSKHRFFSFIGDETLPDNMLICVAIDEASVLAELSSSIHVAWSLATGSRLGVGNDPRYNKTRCFDPFPLPDLTDKPALKARLDALGERLDAFRKERLAEHHFLTMTKLYNVLERVRALEGGCSPPPAGEVVPKETEGAGADGAAPFLASGDTSQMNGGGQPALTEAERDIYEAGLVGVLKDIHDQIDDAVFEAYGWPADLSEEEILERLVALNHERAAEEARGHVRWLRPDFQNPDGREAERADEQSEIALPEAAKAAAGAALPKDDADRARAVRGVLAASPKPLTAEEVAAAFSGKVTEKKVKTVAGMLSILEAVGQAETTEDQRWFAGG